MRRINAILGPAIIALLIIHGIWGAFQLASIVPGGSVVRQILSYIMIACVAAHILIGIKLTVDTLISIGRSKAAYFRGNEEFWIRRASGLALIIFIIYHMFVFMSSDGEIFRLHVFGGFQLAAHILLVITLIVHLAVNIKPLCIALGITGRKYVRDIIIVLTVLMLVCAAAFIIYYLRWNILWRIGG